MNARHLDIYVVSYTKVKLPINKRTYHVQNVVASSEKDATDKVTRMMKAERVTNVEYLCCAFEENT
jgi:hypothetical protein